MNAQLAFFAGPAARATDPIPSHAAAAAQHHHSSSLENRILEQFAVHGPLTDDEMTERLPDAFGPTVKTARSRLTRRGLLVPAGGTRPSGRGREQTIWGLA